MTDHAHTIREATYALDRAERWAAGIEGPEDYMHAPAIATARADFLAVVDALSADLAAAVAERDEQAALAETRKQSRSMYRERAENAERDLAAAREALRGIANSYGCFDGCTATRPFTKLADHTPACAAARAVLAAGGGEEPA